MINGLLHVTTIEADAVRVEYAEINLYKLLEDLRANYDLPSGKDLSLNWDYPSDLPSMRTDGEKLKAVIQNLISNAIKFTEKGGVTVYVRHVPEADMFELKVTNRNRNSQRKGSIHLRYVRTGGQLCYPEVWRCWAGALHCEEIY